MVADPGQQAPSPAKKGATGRRRRRRSREPAAAWWALFALLLVPAVWLRSWRLALLTLLLWCVYEFLLVPTICRVMTRQGFTCQEQVRGRVFSCTPAHQQVKNDALWRLAGMRNPLRKKSLPDPNRQTGVVVYSPSVRGRLASPDRTIILLASAGTLVTVAGMLYGFAAD